MTQQASNQEENLQDKATGSAGQGGNRQLERVAMVLDAVEFDAASASELARRTGLSVSTAHRLALSLVDYGFLQRNTRAEFSLGRRFVRSRLELVSLRALTELRDSTGETAQLWLRRGEERVCVASVDSLHELKATLPVGARIPLPNGSSGRLLSHDSQALDSIELHGWVESVARRTPGLGSVSVPVELDGHMIATLCLAMPLSRCTHSPGQDHGTTVIATAREISTQLSRH